MKYIAIIYSNNQLWESFSQEESTKAIAEQDGMIKR